MIGRGRVQVVKEKRKKKEQRVLEIDPSPFSSSHRMQEATPHTTGRERFVSKTTTPSR
jgi:hypothetical protein